MPQLVPPPGEPSEAVYHLFREVNDHLRATEQKHLQVSVGFLSVTVLALSFLVPSRLTGVRWESLVVTWPRTIAYLVLALAGCATMFAQHVFRGWKKEYLLAAKKLVYSWPIDDSARVSWMRTDRGPYSHSDRGFFRLAGDNVLFYFVLLITSCIVSLFFYSIVQLVNEWGAALIVGFGAASYLTVFAYITAGGVRRKEILDNDWDEFRHHHRI